MEDPAQCWLLWVIFDIWLKQLVGGGRNHAGPSVAASVTLLTRNSPAMCRVQSWAMGHVCYGVPGLFGDLAHALKPGW